MKIFKSIFKKNKKEDTKEQSSTQEESRLPDFDYCQSIGDILWIFDYVFNSDDVISLKAAKTIHRLFNKIDTFKNKELYESFKYIRLNKSEINKFSKFSPDIQVALLCIASQNGNGYSREKALDKLIEMQNKIAFPFILFRLADWVEIIRLKAEKAVISFINRDKITLFLKHHKLINWFVNIERNDLSNLYETITKQISQSELTIETIKTLSEGERYFYYKTLFLNKMLNQSSFDLAANDKYYLIRLLAVRNIELANQTDVIIEKFLSDNSIKVRQVAVSLIPTDRTVTYRYLLLKLIFDKSTSIRNSARRLLKNNNELDFREIYKQSILKKNNLSSAILGLSETGEQEDIKIISDFIFDKNANIRFATVIAIYNLSAKVGIEKAYYVLEKDTSMKVKKAGEQILMKEGFNIEQLREIYNLVENDAKGIFLRLYNRFGSWSIAGDYLKTISENDKKLAEKAEIYLDAWEKYTARLGVRQTAEDKDYVMYWYNIAIKVSKNIPKTIPFIFGDKKPLIDE